ncbi:cholinesterase [Lojkania enalia]|uniref:Carboxylic ester hydrolase n=1 Tax=Lojkania enalia TaxID=147567 RepID=A0A9P4N3H0_9PLEO|nr:cholinesterase [Didymosphaeria enalia]
MSTIFSLLSLTLLSCLSADVVAVPSPQSIGSDLTILTHNDLYAAVIALSTPQSQAEAISRCAALGETLWDPGNTSRDLGFLRYLDYGKITDEIGVYWIDAGPGCQAITTKGNAQTVPCDSVIPALCSQSASLSSPTTVDTGSRWRTSIQTSNQTIVGYRDKLSFRFLGLQYAARPARFAHSKYQAPGIAELAKGAKAAKGTREILALNYGLQCIQPGCGEPTCSEDCHFLNIWTPYLPNGKAPALKKKAVMLWIHGGGFTGGSGSDTTFDGGNMASRGDVVVVTINYRLATLGFLALSNTTITGNYGLADQNTALDWVRAHIEDFGGDKDRITVFGQSAGAASVRALLASPQAKGKFSRAIMQSNPAGAQYASSFSHYLTISEATDLTKAILTELGCTQSDKAIQLACLRAQGPAKLVGERNNGWTGTIARYPVVDGNYLTGNELPLGKAAPKLNVSVMAGIMRDDGGPFSKFSKSENVSEALTEQGFNPGDILSSAQFPIPEGDNMTMNIFNLTSRVTTDAEFRCLGQSTAHVAVMNDVFPAVYSYEIDRGYQITEWNPNPPTCNAPVTANRPFGDTRLPYFRCHSGELYNVFGTLVRQGRPVRDEQDIPFSQYIVDTWTAFGREGDPNPNPIFLTARGYTNTSTAVNQSSLWKPVRPNQPILRILNTVARDEGFREVEQCIVLDFPLDYYVKG